jgi:hypothetical protein
MKSIRVVLRRASYGWGKFNVPENQREYTVSRVGKIQITNTAVGTITEICDWLEKQGYSMVTFEIHDKGETKMMRNINVKMGR